MSSGAVFTEQAEPTASASWEEEVRRRLLLIPNVLPTPSLSWEEATSRVRRLYPRKQVVDRFRDLKNDILFKPNADSVVAVVQLKGPYPHIYRQGRCLEVSVSVVIVARVRTCVCFRLCFVVRHGSPCCCC